MALAHPLHHINSRSRNKRRYLWVERRVSSPWHLSRNSVFIYIYTYIYMHAVIGPTPVLTVSIDVFFILSISSSKYFFVCVNCDPLLFDENEYRVTKMRYLSLATILFLIPGRGIRNFRWNVIFVHIHMCHSNISYQLIIFQPYVHMSFNSHLRKVYIETHAIHLHTFYYDMFTLLMTTQTTKF